MRNELNLFNFSEDEILSVSQVVVNCMAENKVVTFSGDLGAGKTSLIKGICEILGVKEEVNSPTFSLVNEYSYENNDCLYHFDFYRIEDEEEAFDIGVEEYLDSGNVCLIEWPEKVERIFVDIVVEVVIKVEGKNRNYSIKY